MNSLYFSEYAFAFERVLSFAKMKNIALGHTEKTIAESPLFQRIEKEEGTYVSEANARGLLASMFPQITVDPHRYPTYKECAYAAESYLRVQEASKLTFEAIFLFYPLSQMYADFPLYHEADSSLLLERFVQLRQCQSILGILLKRYGYSLSEVARRTKIPYATLYSLKSRRRDSVKLNVETAYLLSSLFHVRIETIAEIEIH